MKLKDSFILSEVGEDFLLLSTDNTFSGVVRLNHTAKFIIECLQKDTAKEDILRQMAEKYDAKRDELAESVEITIKTLREIGALEE